MESVRKKKGRLWWEGFVEKEGFKPGKKVRGVDHNSCIITCKYRVANAVDCVACQSICR